MTTDIDSVRFGCPKCQRRLKAPPTLAGSRTRCPYCQTMIEVPRQSPNRHVADVYPLQTGDSSALDDQPEYVLVICPVCHARMHPETSQIGRQAICPDCGTATTVERPPAPPPKKPPRTADEIGEYPLATETPATPKRIPASEQEYVAVVCSLCHTRMLATADQVGSKMTCPDCGTATVVPPMPPRRKKIDVMAGADRDCYEIVGGDEVLRPKAAPPSRRMREEPAEEFERDEPEIKMRSRRPVLPDSPFLEGTFTFPFHRCVFVRTIILAIWSMLPGIVGSASYASSAAGDAARNPISLMGGAFLSVVTVVLSVMWFAVMSATVMAVVRETAEGCDDIENWPGQVFLDWLGEPVHLFISLSMSAVPGGAVAWLLTKVGGDVSPIIPFMTGAISMFLVFPIVLMSTLETGSMFGVLSLPVWRTFGLAADAWLKFYLTSGATFVAAAAVCLAASCIGTTFGIVVSAGLSPIVWIIYFRLLGRLTWVCADRASFADLERDFADANDEDFDDSDEEDLLA